MGRPISSVVILAPGERVTDAPKVSRETKMPPRPRKARKNISLDPAIWEASNVRRIEAGMTWDEWEGR